MNSGSTHTISDYKKEFKVAAHSGISSSHGSSFVIIVNLLQKCAREFACSTIFYSKIDVFALLSSHIKVYCIIIQNLKS